MFEHLWKPVLTVGYDVDYGTYYTRNVCGVTQGPDAEPCGLREWEHPKELSHAHAKSN